MAISLPIRGLASTRAGVLARLDARADVLIVGGLVAVAAAVRWPYLLLSPQFPSVGASILIALEVVDGRRFPLSDQAPYIGAPFIYLLAAVYKLFGPSVEATQLLALAIGVLTIVPTYLLGRELSGRLAGMLAGGLMATSSAHTVISSHVALSHSLTPLLATTTLWLLARAVTRRDGRSLALAGLGAGLSLQSHPTVAPLLFGAAGAAILARREWLRTRWPYLAVALVLVGYSTLLLHHVQTRFEIMADIQSKQARYLDDDEDAGESVGHGVYVNNLEQLTLALARLVSGEIGDRSSAASYLTDPWILTYVALAFAGLGIAAGRGQYLLLLALVPAVLLPPALSGKFRPILDGRYLMPLVPVLFVGVGLAFGFASRFGERRPWTQHLAIVVALSTIAGILVARPLGPLAEFYEQSQEDGFSNALYLRTLADIRSSVSGAEAVLLDPRLAEVKSAGGGKANTNFAWLLAVSRIPTATLTETVDPAGLDGRLVILHRSTADRLDDRVKLVPLDGRRTNGRDRPSYRAYRIAAS